VGEHVSGHQGFFDSDAQDFDALKDLALDAAPEGTVVLTPCGAMT
jgi:hypothetical protein